MNKEENKYLNKLAVIRNSISLVCFTILAIFFETWWIVLFALLFTCSVNTEKEENIE